MTWQLRAAAGAAVFLALSSASAQTPEPSAQAPEQRTQVPEPNAQAPADDELDLRSSLTLHAGPLTAAPIALVAVQANPYVGNESFFQAGDTAEKGGFRLRRARFGFGGEVAKRASFKLSAELASGEGAGLAMHDAWLGYSQWDFLQIYAGAREVPFSRSAMTNAADSALIERPLAVRSMAPFNQVGVEVSGRIKNGLVGYSLATFNGFQRGTQFYSGYVENYAPAGNRFDGLAYAARVSTEPLGEIGPTIADLHHSPLRVAAAGSFFSSDGGARTLTGAGGDVLLHASGFHLLAEVLWTKAEPKSVPTQPTTQTATIESLGAVAEAGYMVLKDRLGVAGRFEWIDPNGEVDDESDNWLFTGGVGYYLVSDLMRAQADYTHREERAGLSLSNDSLTLQLQLHL